MKRVDNTKMETIDIVIVFYMIPSFFRFPVGFVAKAPAAFLARLKLAMSNLK